MVGSSASLTVQVIGNGAPQPATLHPRPQIRRLPLQLLRVRRRQLPHRRQHPLQPGHRWHSHCPCTNTPTLATPTHTTVINADSRHCNCADQFRRRLRTALTPHRLHVPTRHLHGKADLRHVLLPHLQRPDRCTVATLAPTATEVPRAPLKRQARRNQPGGLLRGTGDSTFTLHTRSRPNADRYAHGYRHFNRHSASDKQPNNDSYTDGDPNGYSIAYLDADVDLYEYTLANSDCDR